MFLKPYTFRVGIFSTYFCLLHGNHTNGILPNEEKCHHSDILFTGT
nr:MAG TPA: hypothetical protein [Caudoviricetes sp.]